MPDGNVRASQQRTLFDLAIPKWYTRKRGEEGIYAEPPFDLNAFIEEGPAVGPLKLVGKVGKSIRAAAIKLKSGKIFEGPSHHIAADKFKGKWDEVEDADGFVTDVGEYLTRKEAVRALPAGSVGKGTEDALDIVGQAVKPKGKTLFHGTNKFSLDRIKKEGFKVREGLAPNITESFDEAASYAKSKVLWREGEPYYVIEMEPSGKISKVHKFGDK